MESWKAVIESRGNVGNALLLINKRGTDGNAECDDMTCRIQVPVPICM